ncbi:MAG TPA: helix-turn-helix domain-containing protein, partial [Albitalea sp.]|nr:helix-turn-helix domain-containing protein [Albitalea sp.]
RFAPQVLQTFEGYFWPGNVRELRNAVERAYVMASGSEIVDACLPLLQLPESVRAAEREDENRPILSVRVGESWAEIERQVVLATLDHFDGHQQRASAALGVSVKTLYNRLRDWSLLPHVATRQRALGGAGAAR